MFLVVMEQIAEGLIKKATEAIVHLGFSLSIVSIAVVGLGGGGRATGTLLSERGSDEALALPHALLDLVAQLVVGFERDVEAIIVTQVLMFAAGWRSGLLRAGFATGSRAAVTPLMVMMMVMMVVVPVMMVMVASPPTLCCS